MLDTLSKDALHHAYIIIGERQRNVSELLETLQTKLDIATEGNPDVLLKNYGTFSIDDARDIQEQHARKVSGDGERMFILAADSLTLQAQNALLKMFEEPGERTHFFLLIPSISRLVPTLLSRVVLLQALHSDVSKNNGEKAEKAQAFISASKAERLKMIKELMADIDKEKSTKQDAIIFLQSVTTLVHRKKKSSEWTKGDAGTLEQLNRMNDYIQDQSSSVKLILEYVAFLL